MGLRMGGEWLSSDVEGWREGIESCRLMDRSGRGTR